jgi:hypothetical protein
MLRAPAITSLSSEARKIRVSDGVERHPIALAIPSGASAVLDRDRAAICIYRQSQSS